MLQLADFGLPREVIVLLDLPQLEELFLEILRIGLGFEVNRVDRAQLLLEIGDRVSLVSELLAQINAVRNEDFNHLGEVVLYLADQGHLLLALQHQLPYVTVAITFGYRRPLKPRT